MVNLALAWLRRNLAWSSSRAAWGERLGLGLVLAGTGVLGWYTGNLTLAQQIFLWGLWLLLLTVLLRRGWYTLCGPILLYDLVRTTRRSRYTLYRFYAYFVIVLLVFFFAVWYWRQREVSRLSLKENAEFAAAFFYFFLGLQLLMATLLTPAYTAGILTQEKERRTLEFLLATDLRNREIVLSRLVSRLANLLLMLLTGLPIFSFVELAGGVEPDLVLAGFAVTAVTMISLASLSALASVYARRSWQAIMYAYLLVAVYLLLSGLCKAAYSTVLPRVFFWNLGNSPVTAADLLDWFMAGNPILQLIELTQEMAFAMARGGRLANSLGIRLRDYMFFHGVVTVFCTAWAVARLRAVFLKQADHSSPGSGRQGRWRLRPGVGAWPMFWKEVVVEGRLRFRWVGRVLLGVLVVVSFLSWLWIHSYHPPGASFVFRNFAWSVSVGSVVACLLLLGVAARAATSLTGERDRQTLDSLLTTPLDSTTILFAKWLGSILSVRWGWLWIGTIWGFGAVLGNLHLLALALMLLAWTVYAALLATLGLWFSLVCQTTQRALVWTFLCTGALGAGFLMLPIDFLFPSISTAYGQTPADLVIRIQKGLTPPVVLGRLLPFMRQDTLQSDVLNKEPWELQAALLGLALWLLAAVVLWSVTSWRFRKLTCRESRRQPERSPLVEVASASPVKQLVSP